MVPALKTLSPRKVLGVFMYLRLNVSRKVRADIRLLVALEAEKTSKGMSAVADKLCAADGAVFVF